MNQANKQSMHLFKSVLKFDSLRLASMQIDGSNIPPNSQRLTHFGNEVLFQARVDGGFHLTSEELDPYRQVGDPELDYLLDFMEQEGFPLKAGDDLLCSSSKALPHAVQARIDSFVQGCREVPSWVDLEQLQRGQDVFIRYSPAMFLSLYYRSLCPGFSVPKIAKVIMATAYLSPPSTPEQVAFRLIDTGALVNECMRDGANLLPDSIGWKSCLHVRVLHAKVRRSLLKRTGKNAWDTSEYGIPINQEDMAATLSAFSINALKGVEFVAGMPLSEQEQEDYLALWRYLGWILGVSTNDDASSSLHLDPCGPGIQAGKANSIAHSEAVFQSIVLHVLKPDQSSSTVCQHLLKCGRPRNGKTDQNATDPYQFQLRSILCRAFIGDPLADALELPLPSSFRTRLQLYAQAYLYLWIARILTWIAMIPGVSSFVIQYYRRGMTTFHMLWTERHPSRMAKALKVDSCCPFAMVTATS